MAVAESPSAAAAVAMLGVFLAGLHMLFSGLLLMLLGYTGLILAQKHTPKDLQINNPPS